jgi:hypothetical protein
MEQRMSELKMEGPRPFADFLRAIEGGELIEDLADQLRELQAALSERSATHDKAKGKLVLTINFTHEKGLVMVSADVATKQPKVVRGSTAMWLSPGNNLVGSDPRQLELKPRAVPATSDAPRELKSAAAAREA